MAERLEEFILRKKRNSLFRAAIHEEPFPAYCSPKFLLYSAYQRSWPMGIVLSAATLTNDISCARKRWWPNAFTSEEVQLDEENCCREFAFR